MYVKTTTRKVKGGVVRYLQLAHNEWDTAAQRSRTEGAVQLRPRRRAGPRCRPPAGDLAVPAAGAPAPPWPRPPAPTWSSPPRAAGRRVRAGRAVAAAGHRRDPPGLRPRARTPRGRPLARADPVRAGRQPGAGALQQAGRHRMGERATCTSTAFPRSATTPATGRWTSCTPLRRTGKKVYDNLAHLLNLEVDLLFFDTTSTYFETENADEVLPRSATRRPPAAAARRRTRRPGSAAGKSKDSRPDLPQVIVGMAVTRDGIPVRAGAGPGTPATPR